MGGKKRAVVPDDRRISRGTAEKIALFLTIDHLKREAAQGSRKDFEKFLSQVPSVPSSSRDKLK